MQLFGPSSSAHSSLRNSVTSPSSSSSRLASKQRDKVHKRKALTDAIIEERQENDGVIYDLEQSVSFQSLGVCDWLLESCQTMGFKRPTKIQTACIPAILEGRDVIGIAETGSGKTAAFAFPVLQILSEDPYGIFCVVITPTRELAVQIKEQFEAFGAPISVRVCLVIGGGSLMEQGANLAKRPHCLIGTPGRMRHHIEGADPPHLKNARFLVLDEADRLLGTGFSSELRIILSCMPKTRQTLLFSATMTENLEEVKKLTGKKSLKFDLTRDNKLPENLQQQYLFFPSHVKMGYLYTLMLNIIESDRKSSEDDDDDAPSSFNIKSVVGGKFVEKKDYKLNRKRKLKGSQDSPDELMSPNDSIIIFANTCKRCEQTKEILLNLNIDCVCLHSMMTQHMRTLSLDRFKDMNCKILIATDVASRGLDIPSVALVINLDVPQVTSDYVHRIGRTARASRSGRSISFVTQHDIELVQEIEAYVGNCLLHKYNLTTILPYMHSYNVLCKHHHLTILFG